MTRVLSLTLIPVACVVAFVWLVDAHATGIAPALAFLTIGAFTRTWNVGPLPSFDLEIEAWLKN